MAPAFAIGNAPLIPSLARLGGFDIVHLHYPFIFGAELTLFARLARRRRSQALLVHYKNRLVGDGGRGALFETYEHTVAPALIRACDRVCILSADHADSVSYLRRTGERDPSKLIVMPNGVDAERFSPGADESGLRERLGIPADAVVAAFVATLDRAHHFKRLDVAIDALAELGDGNVHIVVAGGGELVDDFRARAAERGVGERVHFLGAVPHAELPSVLRASDLFLLTTEPPESFGIVLIEAMATGLPVIATDYPGVRAVVAEGTGLLAPQGDVSRVADCLREIAEMGPEGRSAMGAQRPRAGRGRVELASAARPHGSRLRGGDRGARREDEFVMPRRILFVTYFYPPCTDTGAHRPTSMVKYLRRAGHNVTVLTTAAYGTLSDDDDEGVVRTTDAQLWRARLRGADGVGSLYDNDTYAGKPHPLSKLIVPEPLALAWAPFARRRARSLHKATPFDCVITTSPPESAHSVGRALQRRGAAWVADVRDAWTFEPLRPEFHTGIQNRYDRRLERRLLGAADVVVCVSEPAAADLRARGIADPVLVRNGADPELLDAADPASVAGLLDPERVSLVYTGRFGSTGRDPKPLVEAMRVLAREHPEDAAALELVVAGPLTEDEARLFSTDVAPAQITVAGSLERSRALALQRAADALLLVAHPVRSQLANFKLYEYLSAGPPILALAAGTEAGSVALEAGGEALPAGDPAAIVRGLVATARRELRPSDPEVRAEHAYPAVAERMGQAIEAAIGSR